MGEIGGLRKGSVKSVFKPSTVAFRAYLGPTDPFPASVPGYLVRDFQPWGLKLTTLRRL